MMMLVVQTRFREYFSEETGPREIDHIQSLRDLTYPIKLVQKRDFTFSLSPPSLPSHQHSHHKPQTRIEQKSIVFTLSNSLSGPGLAILGPGF